MAAFVNGDGDLGSTTLENALIEAFVRARNFDNQLSTPTGNITDDIQASGGAIVLNATIPVTMTLVSGRPTFAATDFLSRTFNPGTGGTLHSSTTTYPAALLELAARIQELEVAQNRNVVNMVYNADAGTMTITATMTVVRTVETDGSQKFVATTYLT